MFARAVLKGIEEAVIETRHTWRLNSDMNNYRQEIDAMSAFSDIAIFPFLRRLNFSYVPNSLRSKIVNKIGDFKELRVLIIGSSNGGQWMFRNVAKNLAKGMEELKKLQSFSCKHDSCFELVDVISRNCSGTLRVLDVENSKGVDDNCLESICRLTGLEELNIFHTQLSEESKARILMSLPNLIRLERGDFLCDALGWIDYLDETADFKTLITEFFPSQA